MKLSSTYARIQRRELHSPRSTPAIVVAVALCIFFVWAATEIILALVGAPALLASPADVGIGVVNASLVPAGYLIAVGATAALVGFVLVVLALAAGRRGRHLLSSDTRAAVVDDNVIASAVARRAANTAGIDPDSVRVTVSRGWAAVQLTPSSGIPIDAAAVEVAVRTQLDDLGIIPPLRSRVRVGQAGKVGA